MVGQDRPDELSGSIGGGPAVINVVAAWPNHGRLHKFERPRSTCRSCSDRLKGGKGPEPLMSRIPGLVPENTPADPACAQSRPPSKPASLPPRCG